MILRYLKQYAPAAAIFALFGLIFAAVFALYGLPLEPVWYASCLCALVGLTAVAIHFAACRKRHLIRLQVLKEPVLMLDCLPQPESLLQQDDRAIMEALLTKLNHTQTRLQQTRQDSQDYFSSWVHQIKTPLSVLRLNLQSEDSEGHRAMLNELFSIEQYVDMALGYARLSNPTKDLVLREIRLDEVIRSVIREFAPLMIRKRIALRYAGCDETALSDGRWLRFMLEQVMSNAVKYTTKGSIEISVAAGPKVIIADSGIGIAPEDVPRVFEKGYTGYNGRSKQKSTGLGLYLCRQTADMLGHKVSLHSQVGTGTTVTFDLYRQALEVE